jgi:hypothetical protein
MHFTMQQTGRIYITLFNFRARARASAQALGFAAFLRSVGAQALRGGLCKDPFSIFDASSAVFDASGIR